jgi:integrase
MGKAGEPAQFSRSFALAAIRLLVLTGMRHREVLNLEWRQVDFELGVLFLPDSKTGRKTVFLGDPVLSLLRQLPRIENCRFVIAGRTPDKARADLNRPWSAVRRDAKLEGVRLYDLRHSFASVGAGASLGLPIVGKLLGHSQPATTNRYAHLDADPLRRAANEISTSIAAACLRSSVPGTGIQVIGSRTDQNFLAEFVTDERSITPK